MVFGRHRESHPERVPNSCRSSSASKRLPWGKDANQSGRDRVIRFNAIAGCLDRADLFLLFSLPIMQYRFLFLLFSASLIPPASVLGQNAEKPATKKERVKVAAVDSKVLHPRFEENLPWTLRDDEGREIEAILLSAHGETVKIKRVDDEREFDVPISMFDLQTENRIRNWIDRDPEAVNYNLDITATKELVGTDEFDMAGRSLRTSKWAYRITVANQSRNDLSDASVEYRIVYDDNIAFARTSAIPGKGKARQDGQAVELPEMNFNDEIEFTTPFIETHTYEYKAVKGPRDFAKDEIKGVWIRILRRGEVISEFKTNESVMNGYDWDNEDEIEIKVTNKFRDSFEKVDP